MKKLTLILTVFISVAYGQIKPLNSIAWVSDQMQMMTFAGNQVWFEPNREGDPYDYYLSKDTLVMIDQTFQDRGPDNKMYNRVYKFMMRREGNELFTLTPINDRSKKLRKAGDFIFRNKKYIVDSALKFNLVHLNSGGCLGCDTRTINIDNKGSFYFKKGAGLDTGYFKGKLSAKQLDTLNSLLQHSGIRKLQGWTPDRWIADIAENNLIVEYNGNTLKMKNTYLPLLVRDLVSFVNLLVVKLTLVPDPDKYNFKREGDVSF